MADDSRLGASFSIDITALKAGLQQANRLIKESNSQFKAAAAGMDDWTASEEGLTAKLENLNEVADIQAKMVEALQEEYDKCIADGLDPMSASAVNMRTKLNNAKAELAKTESETKKYKKSLEDLKDSADDAGDEVEDLGDSAEDAGDGFTVAKGAIASFIGNGLTKLVDACANAISSVWGLAESTRESRVAFAKLETAFDSAGLGAEAAEKTMTDLYGVLGDTDKATEAANLIAKMSKNQADLDTNTRILTGVFAEYGDSIPTEALAEAMASSSAMSSVQGVLADALEWQGINLDEYNAKLEALSTEEERATYIQETLTGLYGESADAYRDNNEAMIEANEAQLDYQETLNNFGDMVEPVTTSVQKGFTKILNKILELTGSTDLEAFAGKVDDAFENLTEVILPDIVDGLSWIKDHKDIIVAAILGFGAGWAVFNGVPAIITAVNTAMAILNGTMALNPIGLVAIAVGGLVTAFALLWKKCEAFRNFWSKLWDGIKSVTKVAINGLIGLLNGWIKGLNALLTPVRAIVYGVAKAFGSNISFGDTKLPTIPYLAKGGIVSKATTAVIGENGKEAVVPLENNTEWMDMLADKIASKQQSVVVNQTNNYSQAHSRYEIYKSKQQTAAAVRLAMQGV